MKKSSLLKNIYEHKILYLLLLPGLLYFLIFSYGPMYGIVIAFQEYSPVNGIKGILFSENWVGFDQFTRFFSSYYFIRILRNTLEIFFLKLIFGFPAPIILALLLNEVKNELYKRFIQTISYLPHFLSIVVVTSMVMILMSPTSGIFNQVVTSITGGETINYLGEVRYWRTILVVMNVWIGIGWGTILYLATISTINPELYENAKIEGANRFQLAKYITLPSITFIAGLMLILSLGSILNAGFEDIVILYNAAVYSVADVIDTYIYREGLLQSSFSYSTAIGLFKNVIGLIAVLLSNKFAKKLGYIGIY